VTWKSIEKQNVFFLLNGKWVDCGTCEVAAQPSQ
jgi:hypothetical protein